MDGEGSVLITSRIWRVLLVPNGLQSIQRYVTEFMVSVLLVPNGLQCLDGVYDANR
jgi:hypothetical protein